MDFQAILDHKIKAALVAAAVVIAERSGDEITAWLWPHIHDGLLQDIIQALVQGAAS